MGEGGIPQGDEYEEVLGEVEKITFIPCTNNNDEISSFSSEGGLGNYILSFLIYVGNTVWCGR